MRRFQSGNPGADESARKVSPNERCSQCNICGKIYKNEYSLRLSLSGHTGQKPYKCSYCDKCFRLSRCRVVLTRTHTGEKTYKCKLCGKCFADPLHCKRHQRTHIGEKPISARHVGGSLENNTVLGGMRKSTMKTQHSNVKNVVSVLVIDIRCKDTRKNTLRRSVHSVLNVASDMDGKVTSRNRNVTKQRETRTPIHMCTVESHLSRNRILINTKTPSV